MGFGPGKKSNTPTFLDELKKSGVIDQAVVAFDLGYISKDDTDTPSTATIGGTDSSKYVGEIETYDRKASTWWGIEMKKLIYGN
jgi:hypothetical protein